MFAKAPIFEKILRKMALAYCMKIIFEQLETHLNVTNFGGQANRDEFQLNWKVFIFTRKSIQ